MVQHLQEQPRTAMAQFEGSTIKFQGYFVRFGNKTEDDNQDSITILVKNPFTYTKEGTYVRLGHHIWLEYTPEIGKLSLEHGDRIQAFGRVERYKKLNGGENYCIVDAHDYTLVMKNSDPGKYNCFDFSDTIKISAKVFTKIKTEQKFIRAGKFRRKNGDIMDRGNIIFKMRDILSNGVCRFYYKFSGDKVFSRYAYFSLKSGQIMTFGDGRRFILSEENFFAIKDFLQNVKYSGKYNLPLSFKEIEKERKLESSKAPGKWESIRKAEPGQGSQMIDAFGQRIRSE